MKNTYKYLSGALLTITLLLSGAEVLSMETLPAQPTPPTCGESYSRCWLGCHGYGSHACNIGCNEQRVTCCTNELNTCNQNCSTEDEECRNQCDTEHLNCL